MMPVGGSLYFPGLMKFTGLLVGAGTAEAGPQPRPTPPAIPSLDFSKASNSQYLPVVF